MVSKMYSVIKLTENDGRKLLMETVLPHEARKRFVETQLDVGEQVILRQHVNGDVIVLNTRDNGYCA